MKVLVVSKTISNGGDFLYADRMMKILYWEYPQHEYIYNDGNRVVEDEVLSEVDRIIISGGPNYDNRLMNYDNFSFLSRAIELSKPIYLIGMGCYGAAIREADIYERSFGAETKEILQRIEQGGGLLGTRDFVTSRILKQNGCKNTLMTGCPAWYDLNYMLDCDLPKERNTVQRIIISDPGVTKNQFEQVSRAKQAIEVVDYVRKKFSNADIFFTFNGGIKTKYSRECNEIIEKHLKQKRIIYYDLSGKSEGFSVYNNIDLHIGFRVHSHIYCLSRHIPTILIEEDIRGYGVNDVLGMGHIANSCNSNGEFVPNEYLIKMLDDAIDSALQNRFWESRVACQTMKYYYETGMKKALKKILE